MPNTNNSGASRCTVHRTRLVLQLLALAASLPGRTQEVFEIPADEPPSASLTAAHQPVRRILAGLRIPTAELADGHIVVFGAFDAVQWTEQVAGYERVLREVLPPTAGREVWITGSVSTGARSALEQRGWIVQVSSTDAAATSHWRQRVIEFAAEHFRHPAWGYSHCVRDYELARELAAADKVTLDDDVLFAAAYLHDIAAFAPWEKPDVDHQDVGAEVVGAILTEMGFPPAKLEAVRGAIRTHMYDREPVGPEALYLHDADALDWLGAIGVARIIALVDPNGGKPDGPEAARMLEDYLAQVPPRVLSPAGRARVPPRQAELRQFLENLRHESHDLTTL